MVLVLHAVISGHGRFDIVVHLTAIAVVIHYRLLNSYGRHNAPLSLNVKEHPHIKEVSSVYFGNDA